MEALATDINKSFLNVISHLQPLSADAAPPAPDSVPSEFIIDQSSVEIKLSRINTHKAQGPDDLPNWVLRDFSTCLEYAQFTTHLSVRVSSQGDGRKLISYRSPKSTRPHQSTPQHSESWSSSCDRY